MRCAPIGDVAVCLLTLLAAACAGTSAEQSDAGVEPDPGVDAAPTDPDETPGCELALRLSGYATAAEVLVTGSFTEPVPWAATIAEGALPMTLRGAVWELEAALAAGIHRYKLIVDGQWLSDTSNPDAEDDGYGGFNSVYRCEDRAASCGAPQDFDWRDTVMYFAMTDRFFDSDGQASPVPGVTDGDAARGSSGQYEGGDLAGVRAKLPYLVDLGVTSLWLSAPFENRDSAGAGISDNKQYSGYHGYWPSPANISYADPDAPSPRPAVESRIGDDRDLHALVDTAHAARSANGHGIKVLFDYVMNHVDAQSGVFSAHPEWFAYDGDRFRLCGEDCGGGSCWDDAYWGTRCAFTEYLPPLDLYNDRARAWSVSDAIWWAKEYGIDGYRLDAIKHVPLAWLTDLRTRLNRELSGPDGDRFYLVGETFDYFDRDLLKRFIDPDTMLDGQFDFPLKRQLCEAVFSPAGGLASLDAFLRGNDRFYDRDDRAAIMTTWIGNHDIPRAIHFADWTFGNCTEGSHAGNAWQASFAQPTDAVPYERLALAFAVMLTNPGIPLIYYGDEIGLAGGGDPDNRRMMPWDDSTLNPHQRALRSAVKRLAHLRATYQALGRGARTTLSVSGDTWVYRMGGCGAAFEEVIVAINRADDARVVSVPVGSYMDQMTNTTIEGGEVSLLPRQFMVLTAR